MKTEKQDAAERQRRRRARVRAARAGNDAPGWARLRQPGRARATLPRVRVSDNGTDWELSEGIRQALRDGLKTGTVHPASAARGFRDLQTANAGAYMSMPEVEQAIERFTTAAVVAILRYCHPAHIGSALDYLANSWADSESDIPDLPDSIQFNVICPECKKLSDQIPPDPIDTIIEAAAKHVHSTRRDAMIADVRRAVEKL